MGKNKLLAKHHTGKIRHHKHTSYVSLALILLLTFVPVIYASKTVASAATEGSAEYGTYAVVPSPKPGSAPTISNIQNGTVYTTSEPILVRGSCPRDTLVKLFKNGVLAGTALCVSGSYQMSIDIFIGDNILIARAYNTNDDTSPDSTPLNVQLIPPGTRLAGTGQLNTTGAPAGQFYVTAEVFYKGAAVGDTMSWTVSLAGGQSPYAVMISWGDGKTQLLSRSNAGPFDISHVFNKPSEAGGYNVTIKATDQNGENSYMQFTAIIGGNKNYTGVAGGVKGGYDKSTIIRTAWQLLAIAALVVISFWLGEKREARLLKQLKYGV